MMKLRILMLLVLSGVAGAAAAEGGCPPGQYPYDTSQARQCVPIPGGQSTGTTWSEAFFEDRWGAVAADPDTGDTGVAVGEVSKSNARKIAIQRCAANGSGNCKIRSTFFNQCIAFASGGKYRASATAASEKEAQDRAIAKCADGNDATCAVAWSDCSLPVRVR